MAFDLSLWPCMIKSTAIFCSSYLMVGLDLSPLIPYLQCFPCPLASSSSVDLWHHLVLCLISSSSWTPCMPNSIFIALWPLFLLLIPSKRFALYPNISADWKLGCYLPAHFETVIHSSEHTLSLPPDLRRPRVVPRSSASNGKLLAMPYPRPAESGILGMEPRHLHLTNPSGCSDAC